MTIRVALEHRTRYDFDRPVRAFPHTVRLRPAPHCRTPIEAYSLRIEPRGHFLNWQQDPFGNFLARVVFPEPVSRIEVVVDLVADLTVINPFDFFVEDYAEHYGFAYPPDLRADLTPYLAPVDEGGTGSGPGPAVREWLAATGLDRTTSADQVGIVDFLVAVNQAVFDSVAYSLRMEHGVHSPDRTLNDRIGSCRDSAWLLVSVLRQLGLAARFVSGYLVQLTSDVEAVDGPSGPAADFTDLHAWAEVYIPGAGWVGLDATSGLLTGEGHIPLSATPSPAASAPITGATEPCTVTFAFSNTVRRVHEDPRVTAPYSDAQWAAMNTLGHHVDNRLAGADVRLTMGGEPTFVRAGDTSGEEWASGADGPEKRQYANRLAARLRERWAPGGIVHRGQGKWYPGEPLPRWQIQLTWRADGQPLWTHPDRFDDPWGEDQTSGTEAAETTDSTDTADTAVADGAAARNAAATLTAAIAANLGAGPDLVHPAYEDPIGALWDAVRIPAGPRPERDLEPDAEPHELAAAASDDVASDDVASDDVDSHVGSAAAPAAWVLPLFEHPGGAAGWATTRWRTRRRHLFLIGGTSPAGYRLPLDSLSWTAPPDDVDEVEWQARDPLPAARAATEPSEPLSVLHLDEAPRHALCVEARDGHVFVFLPPVQRLENALVLLTAIEQAAVAADVRLVLEGYPLPNDSRVRTLSVTPDPGVIEVNVQPTRTWDELVELTETLYDDARQVGLASEKFDVDGTHTGTGGGNHFTLGGAAPADSPLLRRPDLLRSLITYWQHHPALSYAFSGRFVGPTSQAPRVDEGRHETLYELELAFAELERVTRDPGVGTDTADAWGLTIDEPAGYAAPAWLTDRLLRHLLTDLTGNTHRSEFCIDKLYSPDSSRGRLGLLELRGFEMPPHPRMALAQALLLRALVARFWDRPYTGDLVRWGTGLHDRFLLPAFAMADLGEVVTDVDDYLGATGASVHFNADWFAPFLEFRFPRLGEATIAGVHLELRQAVEPWHVLGEEMTEGGTSRYVDSSVERVQLAATGLNPQRHLVTCNGVRLPLRPAPDGDTLVAGVRFRAWAPWSALHPTMGVHGPLVFDLVDRWNGRSLGGFTHHVTHPGGRSYEDLPVNAVAAETRRGSRFRAGGHTPGRIDVDALPGPRVVDAEHPFTLDLRRYLPGHR